MVGIGISADVSMLELENKAANGYTIKSVVRNKDRVSFQSVPLSS